MVYLALLFLEVVILFLLSRSMSQTFSRFMPTSLVWLIFLPGVVIHELSHLFIAMLLFVPVGEMEFSPKKTGSGLKLGSVEIAKTDPIRRSVIGFAPVFAGLALILSIVYFVSVNLSFLQQFVWYIFAGIILILIYLLFAISNTMFSSKKDMEGTIEILITLLILFAGAYLLGFRLQLTYLNKLFTGEFIKAIQKSVIFLLAPIAIDLFILGAIRLITGSRNRRA